MRGKTPIDWLWSWLSLYSQGADYEVMESIQPVVDVSIDWPLEYKQINIPYTTIVGTQVDDVLVTPSDKHAMVINLSSFKSAAGQFPAADEQGLHYNVQGVTVPIMQYFGGVGVLDMTPWVGTAAIEANLGSIAGVLPRLYLPPSTTLTHTHTSATAGNVAGLLGFYILRPKDRPMPVF